MSPKTQQTIVGAFAIIAAGLAVFFINDIVSITGAMLSPQTAWSGGVPGTASADDSLVVGTTTLSAANSLEWSLPGSTFSLLIASTPAEQEQGLGDIAHLASTSGMFFIFDQPSDYGFWMRDMEFPLDIIWLDQSFKIIHIERDLSPSTYPTIYYPDAPAEYVVEVNAGTAEKFSLAVGQALQIYQK